jgi:hypothetical protein
MLPSSEEINNALSLAIKQQFYVTRKGIEEAKGT